MTHFYGAAIRNPWLTSAIHAALAAAVGHPVGDVRPPLTTFKELGREGEARLKKLKPIIKELDELVDRIEAAGQRARPSRVAAE